MNANLVRISRTKDDPQIPLAPSTLYKWMHLGKNSEIFVKLGGALFLDRAKLCELIEKSRCNRGTQRRVRSNARKGGNDENKIRPTY
jgi:hypothetical protein